MEDSTQLSDVLCKSWKSDMSTTLETYRQIRKDWQTDVVVRYTACFASLLRGIKTDRKAVCAVYTLNGTLKKFQFQVYWKGQCAWHEGGNLTFCFEQKLFNGNTSISFKTEIYIAVRSSSSSNDKRSKAPKTLSITLSCKSRSSPEDNTQKL